MHTTDASRPGVRYIRILLWTLAALALGYLIVNHPAHLLGWVPFLIIMACPLMHLFMHGRHRHSPHPPSDSHS